MKALALAAAAWLAPLQPPPAPAEPACISEAEFFDGVSHVFVPLDAVHVSRLMARLEAEGYEPAPATDAWFVELMGAVLVVFGDDGCMVGRLWLDSEVFFGVIAGD